MLYVADVFVHKLQHLLDWKLLVLKRHSSYWLAVGVSGAASHPFPQRIRVPKRRGTRSQMLRTCHGSGAVIVSCLGSRTLKGILRTVGYAVVPVGWVVGPARCSGGYNAVSSYLQHRVATSRADMKD